MLTEQFANVLNRSTQLSTVHYFTMVINQALQQLVNLLNSDFHLVQSFNDQPSQ